MRQQKVLPAMNGNADEIRSASCPECIVCGSLGEFIYWNQQDRLFCAAGAWNIKKCSNRKCGLIWPDPMPLTEDIGKAYLNYYTHITRDNNNKAGGLRKALRLIEQEYWANKYNYRVTSSDRARGFGKFLYLFPFQRQMADYKVRFLPAVPQGRLLDVGCGSGDWLLFMHQLGWQVEGLDFDERALEAARQNKLNVHGGTLERQNFPGAKFEAVTLQHVIEHVPDPLGTLSECARVLKPGGRLVLATPNGASLSHRIFGQHWRGLEPPRHLHVFSPASLHQILEQAGFHDITIRPIVAKSVIYESLLLRWGRRDFTKGPPQSRLARRITPFLIFLELCLQKFAPSTSDCIIAIAIKE